MLKKIILFLCMTAIHPAWADSNSGWQTYGDIGRYLLPGIAAAMTAYERDLRGFGELVFSAGVTQLTVEGLKKIVRETRPNGTCCGSFPSGHTAAAFSGASFIQRRYGWQYGLVPYAAAILVGVSRIETNAHYAQDVIAAAILAMGVNLLITKPYQFPHKQKLVILPIATTDQAGLSLTYWF